MELVVGGLAAVTGLIIFLFWWSIQESIRKDRQAGAEEQERQRKVLEEAERQANFCRILQPLHCLGCGHAFMGPLPDTGCPQCHYRNLVVTEEEWQQSVKTSLS